MTRSYKKHPYVSVTGYKGGKKIANRRVRRLLNNFLYSLKGKEYKKLFNSWDIVDYCESGTSFEHFVKRQIEKFMRDFLMGWKTEKDFPTIEELKEKYKRWYKRK